MVTFPSALSEGLRALFSQEEGDIPPDQAWDLQVPTTENASVSEILKAHQTQFADLLTKLGAERELKVQTNSGVSKITVDLCFVLDITGSMTAVIEACKQQFRAIVNGIVPIIQKEFPGIQLELNYALIGFRDYNDSPQFETLDFTNDKEALLRKIESLKAQGGDDLPENVLGALNTAASLKWSSKARFLIFMGDAPPHGSQFQNPASSDDKDPNNSRGFDLVSIAKNLVEKDIDVIFCRIRSCTARFEQMLVDSYQRATPEPTRKVTQVTLFTDQELNIGRFHFIFILDESGSMSGTPWNQLCNAYSTFIAQRKGDQGFHDLVSVVAFNSYPREIFRKYPINQCPCLSGYRGGGTSFSPAINYASDYIISDPADCKKMVIFMSDGADGSSNAVQTVRTVKSRFPDLVFNTVAFGSDADSRLLQEMASEGGGKLYTARTGIELQQAFATIAGSSNAMNTLVKQFSEIISKQVADRIVIDHL
jgi:uncharacterized protein YegL